jgi:hypothetical protein
MPVRSVSRFPPVNVRELKVPSGISGATERLSIPMKTATKAGETASKPRACTLAHPASGPVTTAYRPTASVAVAVTAPAGS